MLEQAHPALMVCSAPPPGESWTPEDAHAVMQVHIEHPITSCPAKRHAKWVLVQANRMVPADIPHIGS
ncbi:hypothetical protein [Nocardia transvalensis]|uniref:hypothetical protein n=1 Tax=Nocardia transvalensis TaxID=37333 RepID=UPI0018955378|nr:hypothetical protein [Nocardia transvalensis]MBF6333595.1 hypothetical protein [Nocardia transvalensis]